jgi:hypothetical protein
MIKLNKLGLLYTIIFFSLTNVVNAINFNLNSVLSPLSGNAVAYFYMRYFAFIDAIIYLILFLSLAQLVFMKVYKDNVKEAKMIGIAVSLALTVSMTVLEMQTGFHLGQLSPVALIIFLLVIAVLLFNLFLGLFTGPNGKSVSGALTYLIIYGLLSVPFGTLNRWIEQNVSLLSAVLAIAAVVAFIYLIIELFKAVGLGGGGSSSTTPGPAGPQGQPGPIGPQGPAAQIPEQPVPQTTPQEQTTQYPEDLREIINDAYPNSINNLNQAYNEYSRIFNIIIQMHHNANNATPQQAEPGVTEWTAVLNARTALTQAETQTNNILNSIRTHANYARLNATDVATLNNMMTAHRNINRVTIDYEVNARTAYNNATVPQAIPRP